jgi:hypothetical protein
MENYSIGKLYKIECIPPSFASKDSSFSVFKSKGINFDEESIAKIKINKDIFCLLDFYNNDDKTNLTLNIKVLTSNGIVGHTRINKKSYKLSLVE